MSDFSNKPKGASVYEAYWQELYVRTEHWKSDLLFYKDDLNFLDRLINKYFIKVKKKENNNKFKEIEVALGEIHQKCDQLLGKTNQHLANIADLIENPLKYDSYEFKMEHEQLDYELVDFVKVYRSNRKNIFVIIEQLIDSEELIWQIVTD